MSIAAGSLTRLVTIEKRSGAVDDANQPLDDWQPFAEIWTQPRGNTGMAAIRQNAEGVAGTMGRYSFRCRYREDLDDTMRLTYAGVVMDITEIRQDFDRKEWTDIVCTLGVSRG